MKLLLAFVNLLALFSFCIAQPFLGEIRLFAGNFPPRGWAFCDGTLLTIADNNALFAILSTTYGGDGRTTFALPDLRGRVPTPNNDVSVQLSGITAETTVDLTNVMTSEATISIPEQTCPVPSFSGGGSSTASVSVSTNVKTTIPFRSRFCRGRAKGRCISAIPVALAQERHTEDTVLAGSGTVNIGDGTGGNAQCPMQDDVTVPASPLTGTATATTTVTSESGTVSIPTLPVSGTINIERTGSPNMPLDVRQPSLGLSYIIALEGIFPPRA